MTMYAGEGANYGTTTADGVLDIATDETSIGKSRKGIYECVSTHNKTIRELLAEPGTPIMTVGTAGNMVQVGVEHTDVELRVTNRARDILTQTGVVANRDEVLAELIAEEDAVLNPVPVKKKGKGKKAALPVKPPVIVPKVIKQKPAPPVVHPEEEVDTEDELSEYYPPDVEEELIPEMEAPPAPVVEYPVVIKGPHGKFKVPLVDLIGTPEIMVLVQRTESEYSYEPPLDSSVYDLEFMQASCKVKYSGISYAVPKTGLTHMIYLKVKE